MAEWKRQYEAYKLDPALTKPNEGALRRQLNAIKREMFPRMLEVTKNAPQMAIQQLGCAFKIFFEGRARYPRYRRKGREDRFTLTNDQFSVEDKRIRIPKLGWLRMCESLRYTGRIVSASIDRVADRWYASIVVDTNASFLPPAENQGAVGVDLGVTALATLSTDEIFAGQKALRSLLARVKRLARSLSRKIKGSRNYAKAKIKLSRLHAVAPDRRIANIRRDGLHKLTTSITRRFQLIGIEDLNVKGMLGNRCLARSIEDMGFGELRRQLEYKAAWRVGQVVVVDRWYPSSKTCSCCGDRLDVLDLQVRQWRCPDCGTLHDRDVNAAINLRSMAVSSTVSACRGEGTGLARETQGETGPDEAGVQQRS